MHIAHRTRVVLIGVCAVLVALIATAFAVGGSSAKPEGASLSTTESASVPAAGLPGGVGLARGTATGALPSVSAPQTAPSPVLARHGSAKFNSNSDGVVAKDASVNSASGVDATRIVKTGELAIRVAKDRVKNVTDSLTLLATAQGGYVSQSSTDLGGITPTGEVVLRIPVAHFQDAITAAEKLGTHVISITTSAQDVTGKYVDLTAKMRALERTRSTYLTILSRARTIGATLAVQQRIDDVQQQIDQLHGQIKLLGNQSSYSTLTVDVVPVGGTAPAHHARHGLGKAWHDSWSRFGRGVDAMVGAIGPIVFVLLLFALLGLIGWFGNRGVRRLIGERQSAA